MLELKLISTTDIPSVFACLVVRVKMATVEVMRLLTRMPVDETRISSLRYDLATCGYWSGKNRINLVLPFLLDASCIDAMVV